MSFFVSTLHLSFGPCINSHILFITFSISSHTHNRIGPFAISLKRRKSPGCLGQIVLLLLDLMLQSKGLDMCWGTYTHSPFRKGEGMRAETFLQVLTPTHIHPLCKEVGSCTKADAGPWNTPSGSHVSLLLLDVTWPALP